MAFADTNIFQIQQDAEPTEAKNAKDDRLDLWALLAAIDRRDLGYYDRLSDRHKKQFSGYMSLMWISYAEGQADLQAYYLQSSNLAANQHLFDINHHPKLQYLCLCAASPGVGRVKHTWIQARKDSSKDPKKKTLLRLFPGLKEDEAELLSSRITEQDIKQYVAQLGEGGDASL